MMHCKNNEIAALTSALPASSGNSCLEYGEFLKGVTFIKGLSRHKVMIVAVLPVGEN